MSVFDESFIVLQVFMWYGRIVPLVQQQKIKAPKIKKIEQKKTDFITWIASDSSTVSFQNDSDICNEINC
jgi:hypothetical protein